MLALSVAATGCSDDDSGAGDAHDAPVTRPIETASPITLAPTTGGAVADSAGPDAAETAETTLDDTPAPATDAPDTTADTATTVEASTTAAPHGTVAGGGLLPAPEGEAFYDAPDPLPGDTNGDLIWARPLPARPAQANAWLVLYRSEDLSGNPIPVSGIVAAPRDTTKQTGTVITWAHGTTGLGDQCAPSKFVGDGSGGALDSAMTLVDRGWTYVATDYEGLGTDGVHPYLVGVSEGRGVIDIVRAAQQLPASGVTPDSQVVVYGHSQGGHAALMTGDIAGEYAPEMDIVGTIAVAPVGDLSLIENAMSGGGGAGGFGLMLLAGFLDAYPELSVDAVADDEWRPLVEQVAETCTADAFALAGTATGPRPNGNDDPAWKTALDQNSPGNVVPVAPVLMVHGDADPVVPSVLSELIHGKYCALGAASQRTIYPGADHGSVLFQSLPDVLSWIDDRLAGGPAPENCGAR